MNNYIFFQNSKISLIQVNFQIAPEDLPLEDHLPNKYRNSTEKAWEDYASVIEQIAKEFITHNKADVKDATLKKDVDDVVALDRKLYEV